MRLLLAAVVTLIASAPARADDWSDLLKDKSAWKKVDDRWIVTDTVTLDSANPRKLAAKPAEGGTIWANGPGRLPDLITKESFGDCEVHVEFLIAKGSNSGIKFHSVYEIQILDSAGKPQDKLSGDDLGGIYPRAEDTPRYHHLDKGIPPKVNAAKPAGEWQTLEVVWKSPRFDDKGNKTADAEVVKATLNGQVIHEHQAVKTPTGSNWTKKETPTGPFMLQADHGPVAFRNVRIRPVK